MAISKHSKEPDVLDGVNQAQVLSEAREILTRMYEEYICLYIKSDDDRDHFLSTFAEELVKIFPRKKKRKSKSRKKSAKAKSRFAPDGIFYWKTKNGENSFQSLTPQKQASWRKSMKTKYPWLGFSEEEEQEYKKPGGIRYWNTPEFKTKKEKSKTFLLK